MQIRTIASLRDPEPAPSPDVIMAEPEWLDMLSQLPRSIPGLRSHLVSLRRIYAVAKEEERPVSTTSKSRKRATRSRSRGRKSRGARDVQAQGASDNATLRTVAQEVSRLLIEAKRWQREDDEDDALTKAASLLDWAQQKLPEIAEVRLRTRKSLNLTKLIPLIINVKTPRSWMRQTSLWERLWPTFGLSRHLRSGLSSATSRSRPSISSIVTRPTKSATHGRLQLGLASHSSAPTT